MHPWLVSLGCGARGAVRSVDGKEGRARALDGVQAKLSSGFRGREMGVHWALGTVCSALRQWSVTVKPLARHRLKGNISHACNLKFSNSHIKK